MRCHVSTFFLLTRNIIFSNRSLKEEIIEAPDETLRNSGMNISAVHLQGSDPSLAELISIFLLRTLLGGEHKLSVKSILLIYF